VPCARNLAFPCPASGRFKYLDEGPAYDLALALRVGHAFQPVQEKLGGILVLELELKVSPEDFLDNFRLAPAEHPVIHEDAGQLISNCFVNECGCHAGIHSAAQSQNHFLPLDLGTDGLDRLVDVAPHRPILAAAADVVDEIGNNLPTLGCVDHLRDEIAARTSCRRDLQRPRKASYPWWRPT
jgi:hypothetical protein